MVNNNAVRIKRELITIIAKLSFEDKLIEKIDRIPLERFPRDGKSIRCCIYKDRAITKYRLMALLGFRIEEEDDELKKLSDYATEALRRDKIDAPVLTVIDEACSSCVRVNYFVTNACRGCVARPCIVNCPKGAIEIKDGQARIDSEKCVNCGLCMKVCPYHAIIYVPVPCEDVCPVGAVSKDEDGKEKIDYEKCIYCGKCMVVCPFSAIIERSQIIDVIKALKSDKKVVALIAPALMGQFRASPEKIAGAIMELGFDDVYEVALGAEVTSEREAEEFKERIEEGAAFMTSSCCPAYVEAVRKHIPELKDYVSTTRSPMHYTAEIVKRDYPDCVSVFISPCVAKRNEALYDDFVDFVLSFEELGGLFMAKEVDVDNCKAYEFRKKAKKTGRGFPISGGVAEAVKSYLGGKAEIRPLLVSGLNKQSILKLKLYKKRSPVEANFIEVMSCEEGCIGGPNVLSAPKLAAGKIKSWISGESGVKKGD